MSRLTVGVSTALLELEPVGGHGKVWHRTLAALGALVPLVPLTPAGRPVRRLRRQRPSVVLADGHAELPPTRLPLVAHVHEAGWFEPTLREFLDPGFYNHIARTTEHAVRSATHVLTLSHAARSDLIRVYNLEADRVHAVHPGADALFTPGLGGGRELVSRALGGREAPYVLYAASLHPRKNLEALRDAMSVLIAEGHEHVLAIAGMPAPDRADSTALERMASAALPGAPGRIAYLGNISDQELAALMAGADAFCLPSLYEGFGLTVLEAMACGTPVVVSDRGALPEVVGDAGVVVEPTAGALAPALAAVLGDPVHAARLGRAAAERARGFTWERTAEGWLGVLREAAGPS
jgi:glycosyltransferase involved in cell wall biosynthesis